TTALALALAQPWLALSVAVGSSLLAALVVWWVWRLLWRGMRRLVAPMHSSATPAARNSPLS
ncbi:DUF4126 domain-containing protein, partial [Xanthomonas oryzae pv. oryzae]